MRADSAYYSHDVVAAARRAGAHFSVTARMTPAVTSAIATIDETAWTPIRYPNAVLDDAEQRWVSDAEVAEVPFTAFTGRRKAEQVTARLIVRRVRRLNPASAQPDADQGELFTAYRYHAVFTDSPMPMLQAESQHRGHAIVEQVHADLKNGRPGGLAVGVVRGQQRLAGPGRHRVQPHPRRRRARLPVHARATTATIRAQLICVPAGSPAPARRLTLHLPPGWPWEPAWQQMFTAAGTRPPAAA